MEARDAHKKSANPDADAPSQSSAAEADKQCVEGSPCAFERELIALLPFLISKATTAFLIQTTIDFAQETSYTR